MGKILVFIILGFIAGILFSTGNWTNGLLCLNGCIVIGCSWDIEKLLK